MKPLPAVWAAGGIACLMLANGLAAQGTSSLHNQEIEFAETQLTLQSLSEENQTFRRDLEQARETIRALTHSVALANEEAEVFRRLTAELKLRMEALGLEALDTDKGKLEQRLLSAVRDLQLEHEEKLRLRDHLAALAEAIVRFLPTTQNSDPQAHLELESQLRAASEALGGPGGSAEAAAAVAPDLTDALVISMKEEFSLIVANVGIRHGVRIGMPFSVWRGEEQIGSVRVVDAREKISGAVIQRLRSDKEKINVGDRLRVETR